MLTEVIPTPCILLVPLGTTQHPPQLEQPHCEQGQGTDPEKKQTDKCQNIIVDTNFVKRNH